MSTLIAPTRAAEDSCGDRMWAQAALAQLGPDRATPRVLFMPAAVAETHDTVEVALLWPTPMPLLAEVVSHFEHLGLRLAAHTPMDAPGTGSTLHRFRFRLPSCKWTPEVAALVTEALEVAARGDFHIDRLCSLIALAGLSWRDIVLVRSISRFVRQMSSSFSEEFAIDTLARHSEFTRTLVARFHAAFDPRSTGREAAVAHLDAQLAEAVEGANSLDEDRTLRGFSRFVAATVRTNWYQRTAAGTNKPYASFKLRSRELAEPGQIVPYFEIFVCSDAVEGIHVRGGAVARGGLRWSDRVESYRTEVLELMKTQMVKNAPIVPAGAKGAFVIKDAATTPAEAYATFIRGLLDLTDNLVGGAGTAPRAVAPLDTVTYDGPDTYLVVAADKGTARFSDLANAIAADYGFWLGDAFASGGSQGYDHKAMGITARGAWLSVRRHFAELGTDTERDTITVAGVGDMSGDVFGNGMLRSPAVRLVAAFDHRHIFLDPEPDAAASFAERRRLYDLPGSSWADYRPELISPGGGVWPRDAKRIPLAPEAQARLAVTADTLAPHELIKAILRAPVDLLWNGGVGTYVKSSQEDHPHAADPVNDPLRVDADELRCAVVGEGGNLGFTQRARVEFALRGGRINADFIDNAAGVATSDREVNLKIALDGAVASGALSSAERNQVLAASTDFVAESVLADCARQTLAISLAEAQAVPLLGRHERLIEHLESKNGLDRGQAVLPTRAELTLRTEAGVGLTRPEIATLLAHSKNVVRDDLLAVPAERLSAFVGVLDGYFPPAVREVCAEQLHSHRLHREIVATEVADELINHVGPGLIYLLEERLGTDTTLVAQAYAVVREVFQLRSLWDRALRCSPEFDPAPLRTVQALQAVAEKACAWILRSRPLPLDPATEIDRYRAPVQELFALHRPLTSAGAVGAEPALAAEAFALAETAITLSQPIGLVAQTYLALGRAHGVFWLLDRLDETTSSTYWDVMATAAVRDRITGHLHRLVGAIVTGAPRDCDGATLVDQWRGAHKETLIRLSRMVAQARADGTVDLARATTIDSELSRWSHTSRR